MYNNLEHLKVYNYNKKIRLGSTQDGGYVIGLLDGKYDLYISAGVSNEESFSRDFIKLYNMNKSNAIAFDGTIENYPYEYTTDITFHKKNISPFKNQNNVNLLYFTSNYNNIFLKMDIESCEYDWIKSLSKEQLNSFKQIVIEFHGINDNSWNVNLETKLNCFKLLADTHFIIHIHGNNHGTITNNIPDTIEVTYIRKNELKEKPILNTIPLPQFGIDFPNNWNKPDYNLNFKPFVNYPSTF